MTLPQASFKIFSLFLVFISFPVMSLGLALLIFFLFFIFFNPAGALSNFCICALIALINWLLSHWVLYCPILSLFYVFKFTWLRPFTLPHVSYIFSLFYIFPCASGLKNFDLPSNLLIISSTRSNVLFSLIYCILNFNSPRNSFWSFFAFDPFYWLILWWNSLFFM